MTFPRTSAAVAAVALGSLLLVGTVASPASAAIVDGDLSEYCADVQTVTASMDEDQVEGAGGITNVVYDDDDPFLYSKSASEPLTTRQFAIAEDDVTTIFCKGRSSDAIQRVYGDDAAGPERPCSDVIELEAIAAWEDLTPEEQDAAYYSPEEVVILDDEVETIGPNWAKFDEGEVFRTITKTTDTLTFQANSLYVSIDNTQPVPEEFKGNAYCTLPSPGSVRAAYLTGPPAEPTTTPTTTPTASASSTPTDDDTATIDDDTDSGNDDGAGDDTDAASAAGGNELAATGSSTLGLALAALVILQVGLVLAVRGHRAGRIGTHS